MKNKLLIVFATFLCTVLSFIISISVPELQAQGQLKKIYVQGFEITDKTYNGEEIVLPDIKFYDSETDERIYLDDTCYKISFSNGIKISTALPYIPGEYTAILELTTDEFYIDEMVYCYFEIFKAPGITINLKNTTIISGQTIKKPEYTIQGECYDRIMLDYFIEIQNGQLINLNDVNYAEFSAGRYALSATLSSILPYYEEVIITQAEYIVNNVSSENSDEYLPVVISCTDGVNPDYTICVEENLENIKYFNETYKIVKCFSIHYIDSENEKIVITDAVCRAKFNIKNIDKFSVYAVKNDTLIPVVYAINGETIIFNIDNVTDFVFVYTRTRISLIAISFILILLSAVEVYFALKVFGQKGGKKYSIISPALFLIYIENADFIFFMLSIWLFILCSIKLYVSMHEKEEELEDKWIPPEPMKIKKIITSEQEDDELFNFIMETKSHNNEEFELEEISEENK